MPESRFFMIKIEPDTQRVGRYRWNVSEGRRVREVSVFSFATKREAQADADKFVETLKAAQLPDKIANPGPLLGVMRTCREAMTHASSQVKPFGTTYHGLSMVVASIDALAALLIGRESNFWAQGSAPASHDVQEREPIEREAEAGLRPWQDG
jgi:hypothetical protein